MSDLVGCSQVTDSQRLQLRMVGPNQGCGFLYTQLESVEGYCVGSPEGWFESESSLALCCSQTRVEQC